MRTSITALTPTDLGQAANALASLAARTTNLRLALVFGDLARQAAQARSTAATR